MHNIEYFSFPQDVDKKKVAEQMDRVAEKEGDCGGGLPGNIRWIQNPICANYDNAQKTIELLDKGNYDQFAVRYYNAIPFADDKKREQEAEVRRNYEEYSKREAIVYPRMLNSAFLGCKQCGSRLAVKLLTGNKCPVCKHDLRPEYMMKSISAARAKWERSRVRLEEYIDKHAKKEINWLVKIEYHS